ncbi:leucyl aminopeptidase [Teredinibacter purpureus]|uniref:leucyl aminopeptidase n=1 Tax=Teredinibacter purpureus TaxID=2731756 RepID=UPI0005F82397|nr:leucyl aminopeptidase [Teredinibacter purpureus]
MQFSTKKTDVLSQKTGCAVVFAFANTLLPSAKILDEQHGGALSALIDQKDLKLSAGHKRWITLPLGNTPYQRVMLVQLGKPVSNKQHAIKSDNLINAFTSLATGLKQSPVKDATVYIDDIFTQNIDINHADECVDTSWVTEQLAIALEKSFYTYSQTKSKPAPKPALTKIVYASIDSARTKSAKTALARGAALGAGINLARELGNLPPNICTPTYLANLAKTLASNSNKKLTARDLNQKQMEKLGMGAFLSVAKGSSEEGRMIIMEYKGTSAANSKPHVLVGKGVTFDTGGISLKPGSGMDEMKFDMCGAASVFGSIKALVDMKAKVHVVAIVAAAENMPAGNASKPGDVVTSMSGQTIEILNTDAEGRLVLCDALTYAERFKPKSVVDIATLTGACVVALGNHASALYTNHQPLAEKLLSAGIAANDKAWQMPLWDEYQKQLDSNFADMANIGGMPGGSITAACFLSRYAKKYHWAHLDIAGTAWHSGARKGATGRPVALLVNYLLNT